MSFVFAILGVIFGWTLSQFSGLIAGGAIGYLIGALMDIRKRLVSLELNMERLQR